MKKLPSGIKRRNSLPKPKQEFEDILPAAISAVSSRLPSDVEVIQVYIGLRQEDVKLSYDYEKE